jgi:hypothetical protein
VVGEVGAGGWLESEGEQINTTRTETLHLYILIRETLRSIISTTSQDIIPCCSFTGSEGGMKSVMLGVSDEVREERVGPISAQHAASTGNPKWT